MSQDANAIFLEFSGRKLRQLESRIEECVKGLTDDQIWLRTHDTENAIGNLLLHLAGNVRQWIIAAIGGKPDIRVRDREFAARGDISGAELVERLRATVEEAAAVIEKLPHQRLTEMITVQKYHVSVLEAVYHVVEHFSQHTGQVIFGYKLLTGNDLGFYRHLSAPTNPPAATP